MKETGFVKVLTPLDVLKKAWSANAERRQIEPGQKVMIRIEQRRQSDAWEDYWQAIPVPTCVPVEDHRMLLMADRRAKMLGELKGDGALVGAALKESEGVIQPAE
jgi:hypothetical protein